MHTRHSVPGCQKARDFGSGTVSVRSLGEDVLGRITAEVSVARHRAWARNHRLR
jgi:hypothetical protein